jgi:type IV secretory pathway VirD2 relaxase
MASRDEDRFRVRPTPPKSGRSDRWGRRAQRFVSQVLKQVSKAGATSSRARNESGGGSARPASTFGRGRVAAGMAGHTLAPTARRVVIKSRYVVLKKAGAKAVSTHLRYIERDGVTRDGQRGQAYGLDTDTADLKAFAERGRDDRHQFRFIVSVEDAEQMADLRGYTRAFMRRMATDLETRLDWVAVDHWDTDNPHTHIVLRGYSGNELDGQDLVIAPDYMAHGMRMRASALATEWLGPRTEQEIQQGLQREVDQERLTSLDRALLRQATANVVDLTGKPTERQRQAMLRARLQRLEAMGLAARIDAHHWQLAGQMESTLTAMGERGDILRTMHKALQGQQREYVTREHMRSLPVVGRIAGKGLADELNDRGYVVVDGIDGRAHYVPLAAGVDLSELPIGGIVGVNPSGHERTVDRTISSLARDGIYRTADHLAKLQRGKVVDPVATIEVHVRRLEALRRGGVVERVTAGVWRVPHELVLQAQAVDAKRSPAVTILLRSHLPIDQQVWTIGATWLDHQLIAEGKGLGVQGFADQVRTSMQGRVEFLVEHGLAERVGQRAVLARNLLGTLRERELTETGKALQAKTGMTYRPVLDGERVSGTYRRSVQLVSGRFAMLDDGMGFSLVPWKPVLEARLGLQVEAFVRGQSINWNIERQLGVGR